MKVKLLSLILKTIFKNYSIMKDVQIIVADNTAIIKTDKSLINENSTTEIKGYSCGSGVVGTTKVHIPVGGTGGNK